MTDSVIKAIDETIKNEQSFVKKGDALLKLNNNRDFKEIVLKGYLEDEAIRLVHLKADPSMQTPERQSSIIRQIDAIGEFKDYLNEVLRKADMAVSTIELNESERESILAGDDY